jgi:hypothetical protein
MEEYTCILQLGPLMNNIFFEDKYVKYNEDIIIKTYFNEDKSKSFTITNIELYLKMRSISDTKINFYQNIINNCKNIYNFNIVKYRINIINEEINNINKYKSEVLDIFENYNNKLNLKPKHFIKNTDQIIKIRTQTIYIDKLFINDNIIFYMNNIQKYNNEIYDNIYKELKKNNKNEIHKIILLLYYLTRILDICERYVKYLNNFIDTIKEDNYLIFFKEFKKNKVIKEDNKRVSEFKRIIHFKDYCITNGLCHFNDEYFVAEFYELSLAKDDKWNVLLNTNKNSKINIDNFVKHIQES